jgi:hypothetical protein
MTLSIVLNEGDLRAMSSELRDGLLKWYFDASRPRTVPATLVQGAAPAPAATIGDDESRRVTFAKLVTAGLLKPGDEISYRTMKRQRRDGKPKFIKGARVSSKGTVDYDGKVFSNASTLAVAMAKQSGGKPTSLNGFDYLFVQTDKGLVPLKKLRARLMDEGERELRFLAEGAVQDAKEYYGYDTEIEDHLPRLRKFMGQ